MTNRKSFLILGMAKQIGSFKLQGCYDNICFYKMDGQYYAKAKSSLDSKRVRLDPAFKETMRYAALFGRASKLAAIVYRVLPQEKKEPGLYKKLTGQAMRMLREGKTEKEVLELLQPMKVEKVSVPVVAKKKNTVDKISFADEVLFVVFGEVVNEEETICCGEEAPP